MPSKKDPDDDPVLSEYDVYVTKNLIEKYYLLQFPTRDRERPYNEECLNRPLAVRFKPKTGFVELDVPLNTEINYDKRKAAVWGDALAKTQQPSTSNANGNGYGLAVGFSQAARGQPGRRAARASSPDEDVSRPGLERQTLGGQMMHDEHGKPNYMIGTFLADKRELHLTDLAGVVQMRPQFHHIDAKTQAERAKARRDRDPAEPATAPKSSIVQMSYTSVDPDQSDMATTKSLLQSAHEEQWSKLTFYDEEESDSYQNYNDHLFLPPAHKKTELVSSMNNERYLDAISAPRLDHRGLPRTKPLTKKQKAQIALSDHEDSEPENVDRPSPDKSQLESAI